MYNTDRSNIVRQVVLHLVLGDLLQGCHGDVFDLLVKVVLQIPTLGECVY